MPAAAASPLWHRAMAEFPPEGVPTSRTSRAPLPEHDHDLVQVLGTAALNFDAMRRRFLGTIMPQLLPAAKNNDSALCMKLLASVRCARSL